MPTHEAVVSTVAPKPVEQPIPVRTVTTRVTLKPENTDQPTTSRSDAGDVESPPAAESVKLSPQLSALARKEQAFRQREQALKTREKELEARLSEADQYSQLKTKLSEKDYSEAERLGLSYEGYTQYLIDKQAGEDPKDQALKALEAKVQALEKGTEEKATQEYEETVAEYRKEIESLITVSAEFPRTKKAKKEDAVLQLILDSWEQDGEELTVEESAKLVEAHLSELASMLTLEEAKKEADPEERPKLPPPRTGSKTLTQNMAPVGIEKKPLKPLQYMSEEERYAEARRRALEKMKGNN